jgi:hypothetical protein
MGQNVFVVIVCLIVLGAGGFAWWMENGKSDHTDSESENEKEV